MSFFDQSPQAPKAPQQAALPWTSQQQQQPQQPQQPQQQLHQNGKAASVQARGQRLPLQAPPAAPAAPQLFQPGAQVHSTQPGFGLGRAAGPAAGPGAFQPQQSVNLQSASSSRCESQWSGQTSQVLSVCAQTAADVGVSGRDRRHRCCLSVHRLCRCTPCARHQAEQLSLWYVIGRSRVSYQLDHTQGSTSGPASHALLPAEQFTHHAAPDQQAAGQLSPVTSPSHALQQYPPHVQACLIPLPPLGQGSRL